MPPPGCPPPIPAACALGIPARATPAIKAIMILRNIVHSPSDDRVNLRIDGVARPDFGHFSCAQSREPCRSMADAWSSWDDLQEWELICVAFTGESNSAIRGLRPDS